MHPPLTTVRTPREAIGKQAAEMLISLMKGEEPVKHQLDMGFDLMIRASC